MFVLEVVNKEACWVGSLKLSEFLKILRLLCTLFIDWRRFIVCETTGSPCATSIDTVKPSWIEICFDSL